MPKLTTKLAPATKAMKQPGIEENNVETSGTSGTEKQGLGNTNNFNELPDPQSYNDLLDEEAVEQVFLNEDVVEDYSSTVPRSERSAKSRSTRAKVPAVNADPYEGYNVVISQAMALKLNPKTQNHIFFDVAVKQADNKLYLRMSGNEGGGLHSKEWLPIEPILSLIDKYQGQSFKSTIFNSLFKGSSANNAGFLGAVLRSPALGLLKASDVALFQHQVPTDYEAKKAVLTALNPV